MLQRIQAFYRRPDIRAAPFRLTLRRLNLEMMRRRPGRKALTSIRTFRLTDGLLVSTSLDDVVGYNLYTHGVFEWNVRQELLAAIHPGAVVLDVGAHLGSFTLPAARAVGEAGRVIALEPHPDTRSLLHRNIRQNRLEDRVNILPFAALDRADRLCLGSIEPGNSGAAKLGLGSNVVECRRIDEMGPVRDLTRLDVVKIDVEGFEAEVLEGMGSLLERFRPVVIFEVNDERALNFFDLHPSYEVELLTLSGDRKNWCSAMGVPEHAGDTLNAVAHPV